MDSHTNVDSRPARNPHTGQIIFQANSPYLFIATRSFSLGENAFPIRKGMEIYYDGQTATIDGEPHRAPKLRGALNAGWLVLAEDYDPNDPAYQRRVSANIQVRSATNSGNPMNPQRSAIITTESDEREVGNYQAHANRTRTANSQYTRGQGVNVPAAGSRVLSQHGMMVVEEQDGVEVPNRSFQTPTKLGHVEVGGREAADILRQADSAQIQPGRGITQDEMLERMSPEQAEAYLQKKEAFAGQYVAEPVVRPVPVRAPSRVASTRHEESSGISMTTTVSSSNDFGLWDGGEAEVVSRVEGSALPAGQQAKPAPARLVSKKPAAPALSPTVRLAMAKSACADFPDNYDFALPTKKKMARITADYEDRHDVLRAIYVAEDDEMRGLLVTEFPQAFE